MVFIIILSAVLWLASFWMLFKREMAAPAVSFLALFILSLAKDSATSRALLPINSTILTAWLCMTLVVVTASWLQPDAVKAQHRGVGYMTIGAFAGMAVGLLAFSVSVNMSMLYASMMVGVCVGIFLGYLLFTRTPDGNELAKGSNRFFRYLLAKGFPIAITVMIPGVVCVISLAIFNNIVAY
ncbi:MAG: hypothetical protein HDS93_03360 [Bacteroidales bacterium]|nr:hypothetical protein [Bacteroidales bacterium]MBD5190880.1 hypothetical protein [Bacteroidales bacterium]MBD5208604.1 hypothetical protein [Bacteroidales bacterium]